MIRTALAFAAATAAFATTPAAAQAPREIGKETTIAFAGGGGIRNWEKGESDDIVYLQGRRLEWYRVVLSGPCLRFASSPTLVYNTDTNGRFDRFSTISDARTPEVRCGVESVKTSLPPKGQPGHKTAGR